ncbi:coiled-coil-helix-coiled-coil-helix domain-containing protein 1 [Spea bombifrons]|uniref:coiled-coil-helix-coiled-coil-helix domain-containing protein 1 n=1 Tax=Spea bombifrons TaxID=233779 RepID=UPI002349AB2E|nr:coiled-coil-helix-coiled-coil-helix domain-containing protein 1 [Spea bombifrons]
MASQGVSLQNKVAKLLSRRNGKPVLKPTRALALADTVANRRPGLGEATCITEMSVMMACWKQNTFSDAPCSKEIETFFECVKKAEATRKSGLHREVQAGRLPPKQLNQLLKRFPNINHEI